MSKRSQALPSTCLSHSEIIEESAMQHLSTQFRYSVLAAALVCALGAQPVLAADVSVTPVAGSGFVVKDNTGATERLRVQESGIVTLPAVPEAAVQATALCIGAGGQLGPCGGGGGGGALPAGTVNQTLRNDGAGWVATNTLRVGNNSNVAMGDGTTAASGNNSTAMGSSVTASGDNSTAMGYGATASGVDSTAMGWATTASGAVSTAMGAFVSASGDHSTAMGSTVSTRGHKGSFIYGDWGRNGTLDNTADNQFMVIASGGTIFYSNAGATTGVSLAAGGGSWTNLSDRNAKTAVVPIDAREVLEKVAALPLNTWQYKTQEARYRHMGPMAQDFYAAFALGESDTGIDEIDGQGVALAAIQGLNEKLSEKLKDKDAEIAALRGELAAQKAFVTALVGDIAVVKAQLTALHRSAAPATTVALRHW
jgi:hypothetical protein